MSVKAADIDRVFTKLRLEVRDGKDKIAWLVVDDVKIWMTGRSHGKGAVGGVAHLLRQQLKVNEATFRGLIQCPVSRDDYLGILREKKILL